MPHAGYIYSGKTASHAGPDIQNSKPQTIVLLGPDHHVGMTTSHLCQKKYWQTPLGILPIAQATKTLLREHPDLFADIHLCDEKEHSLEVILPFLQTWLTPFNLLPIVTGQVDPVPLAKAINPLVDRDTLLVVSSDLSHFLPAPKAETKDKQTIDAILEMNLNALAINDNKACGLIPICALIILAKARNWIPRLLHYSHSGDTSGDFNRVVGYATIGFYTENENAK